MKEFEKWWKNNKNIAPYNMIPKPYIKEGFRAALKWILRYDGEKTIYEIIKEELPDVY